MGWSSGSGLFAEIAALIVNHVDSEETRAILYEGIVEHFEERDCDTLSECTGIDDVLDEILIEKYDLELRVNDDEKWPYEHEDDE
jgi:hypothetical protein